MLQVWQHPQSTPDDPIRSAGSGRTRSRKRPQRGVRTRSRHSSDMMSGHPIRSLSSSNPGEVGSKQTLTTARAQERVGIGSGAQPVQSRVSYCRGRVCELSSRCSSIAPASASADAARASAPSAQTPAMPQASVSRADRKQPPQWVGADCRRAQGGSKICPNAPGTGPAKLTILPSGLDDVHAKSCEKLV